MSFEASTPLSRLMWALAPQHAVEAPAMLGKVRKAAELLGCEWRAKEEPRALGSVRRAGDEGFRASVEESGAVSKIEDYALLGDCETAALVGRDGSVDWLCWPRFDSGACFAALLGGPENGRWLIAPRGTVKHTTRRYRANTLILETDIATSEGVVTLVEFMPPRGKSSDLVRLVIGKRGTVPMRTELVIRFGYGAL